MNIRYLIVVLFMHPFCHVHAQTCLHTDLSKKFDYKITLHMKKITNDSIDRDITLCIINKKNQAILQKINFISPFLFDTVYTDCNAVRSYITGKNEDMEAPDYDFGDLIIADLNFDGKEDIAIKYDSGGNGGPFYNFYLQSGNGKFVLSHFLTDHVGSFPKYVNSKHKTVTTQIHANVHQEGKKTFRYNPTTKKWRLIRWVMVDY
jgi:hypothetical protein